MMPADVARDLGTSARQFLEIVWPAIAGKIGSGRLVPVESATAEGLAKQIDVLGGVDAWQLVEAGNVMRGIASRVQPMRPGQSPWDTFTVRYSRPSGAPTEYQKRLAALESPEAGWLYPAITIQAYVRDGALLSACAVRTRDLFAFLKAHVDPSGRVRAPVAHRPLWDGSATMIAVPFDVLEAAGVATRRAP